MQEIENFYIQFLANFPIGFRPIISIILAVFLIYSIFKVIKQDFIYIIVLIILLPGSIPILKNIYAGLVEFIKFMLHTK